jgi:hypothetical protein
LRASLSFGGGGRNLNNPVAGKENSLPGAPRHLYRLSVIGSLLEGKGALLLFLPDTQRIYAVLKKYICINTRGSRRRRLLVYPLNTWTSTMTRSEYLGKNNYLGCDLQEVNTFGLSDSHCCLSILKKFRRT